MQCLRKLTRFSGFACNNGLWAFNVRRIMPKMRLDSVGEVMLRRAGSGDHDNGLTGWPPGIFNITSLQFTCALVNRQLLRKLLGSCRSIEKFSLQWGWYDELDDETFPIEVLKDCRTSQSLHEGAGVGLAGDLRQFRIPEHMDVDKPGNLQWLSKLKHLSISGILLTCTKDVEEGNEENVRSTGFACNLPSTLEHFAILDLRLIREKLHGMVQEFAGMSSMVTPHLKTLDLSRVRGS